MVQKKIPTWADLKAFANTLTDEQLNNPIRWWGDERGGIDATFGVLEEDYVFGEEGYSPKSSYDEEYLNDLLEDSSTVMIKGTPMIYVD